MLNEVIKPPPTSDNNIAPGMAFIINAKIQSTFERSCLKQDKISFNLGKAVHLDIVYELNFWSFDLYIDFLLGNCLFGAVRLTENLNNGIYRYSGYGIARLSFSLSNGNGFGKHL